MHDVTVAVVIVVLLAGLLLLSSMRPAGARRRTASRSVPGLSTLWVVGIIVAVLALVRFGLPWLAVVAGALAAGARTAIPLLQSWALLRRLTESQAGAGSASAGAARGAGSAGDPPRGRPERMSRQEALQILGLDATATRDDVQREYRRLMKRLHPDLGGSSYLAAKLNEARDVLS